MCISHSLSSLLPFPFYFLSNVSPPSLFSSLLSQVTEYDAAMMLESYRAKASPALHMGPSFDTIAGFGPNGAIIHYKPAQGEDRG